MANLPPLRPPPPTPPLKTIAEVFAQPAFSDSIDRIAFSCIVVSVATGQAQALPTVLEFSTSKSDNGDAGTFDITFPMAPTFEGMVNPAPKYAQIAQPMDVLAIYAARVVSSDERSGALVSPSGSGPNYVPVGAPPGVTYGVEGFIALLGQPAFPTCIFIGMVDHVEVVQTADPPTAHLYITGHDLTKVFLTNDAALPVTIALAMAYNTTTGFASGLASNAPVPVIPPAIRTATSLVEDALDYMISRKPLPGAPFPPGIEQAYSQYAYPWRNFISLSRTSQTFYPLDPLGGKGGASQTPPFQIQDATAWANLADMRNTPVGRLFVDEFANLVFDDAFDAWTKQNPIYTLTNSEVLNCRFYIDDSENVTVITVWPLNYAASNALPQSIKALKGTNLDQQLPGGSQTTPSSPTNLDPGNVQKYGMRYGKFHSFWDVTLPQSLNRWRYFAVYHGSMCFAEVTVRGRPIYTVGQRVALEIPAHRAEFTNAVWYITNVAHNGSFGGTWTTRLYLRFPVTTDGQMH